MKDYAVYLPSYSIGEHVYEQIGDICGTYGKTAVLIGGEKALKAAEAKIRRAAEGKIHVLDTLWYGGECSEENVAALTAKPTVQAADMIFAAGGGKALDTGKALAEKLGKPVFTFPTIASTCAACTAVSILYEPDGRFKAPFFLKRPPRHAFIDMEILAESPARYMWAGLGDTYAKYFEATVSSRGEQLPHYTALGIAMSSMCLTPLLAYGAQALQDQQAHRSTYALEQTVLAIIVSTAMVSILVTKEQIIDYNTGLAHGVFYALTRFPDLKLEENHLHGEVVGFGVLVLLLVDGQREMFAKMYDFNRSVKLPTRLEDIDVTEKDLARIIPQVLAMPDIAHNPYPITEEMLRQAFSELQSYSEK